MATRMGPTAEGMVDVSGLEEEDEALLMEILRLHLHYTRSTVAAAILGAWGHHRELFHRVLPRDYRRVLEKRGDVPQRLHLATL